MSDTRTVEVLVAEIGSTTTVVSAFAGVKDGAAHLLGQGAGPTTVEEGDVVVGLRQALDELAQTLGVRSVEWERFLACSSAAGGLQMTVHGLVYDMTVKAANEAALGAGAVVRQVTAGQMSDADLRTVAEINPSILLLAGGVDYGERETVIANAQKLASLGLEAPVVYAGNIAARKEVEEILGNRVHVVDNVYPRIDQLEIEPTRRAIQRIFEEHIVRAPGMGRVRELIDGEIMPVPGAVMQAARCFHERVGDLVAIDVGGATTDVHSVTEGSEEIARILVAPEPFAKRTVEGDLGVYVNVFNLVSGIGEEALEDDLGFSVAAVLETLGPVPETEKERALVQRLTREAVSVALGRHAGRTRHLFGPSGRMTVAEGKDLTEVRLVIGTGGALTRLPGGLEILREALSRPVPAALYPRSAEVMVDHDYIMAAAGMLSLVNGDAAARLLMASLGMEEESLCSIQR